MLSALTVASRGKRPILVPFSSSWLPILNSRLRNLSKMMSHGTNIDAHRQKVDGISAAVQTFYRRQEKFRINHGSTNSTRSRQHTHRNVVDTSQLDKVISIDVSSQTALVEPNVSMDRLVEATLEYDLIPPVVMEFPGITVGGGYAGTAGESSSFKHGFFDRTMNFVEMVLADGSVVTCSNSENRDLFEGAAGALGTLGITTLVELQLRPAKRYVETTYYPISSVHEAVEKLKQLQSDSTVDYVDGILFSKTEGAIIAGRLSNVHPPNTPIQTFSDANDPWFYLHVQSQICRGIGPVAEAIPLPEYLFRYDRGGFWVGTSAFKYFNMPFNRFTRWWLDDFLHTRMMYTALHASGQSSSYVVQDLALPYSTIEEFIDYTDRVFGIWPLWLCPLRQECLPTIHPHSKSFEADGSTLKSMLNVGLWGPGPQNREKFLKLNRDLEHKLQELGGMKWLYAQTFCSEADFWKSYDYDWYTSLRQKYRATSLPTVYEKVRPDDAAHMKGRNKSLWSKIVESWPFGGLYGIKKAIDSGSYLESRASSWKRWAKEGLKA